MASETVTLTITRESNRPTGRYVVNVVTPNGRSQWPFDWPADLDRYVARMQRWANRKGYEFDVQDRTV